MLARAQQPLPFRLAKIHLLRRHRFIGRRPERLRFEPLDARHIMFLDLLETTLECVAAQLIKRHARFAGVIEDGLERVMKKRQPMFHAGIALAFAHGLIERIIARRAAEQLNVVLPKPPRRFFAKRTLADRHQNQLLDNPSRALRFGIERLNRFKRIAKKSSRTGVLRPGGKRSRIPPRTANSPASITVPVR